VPKRKSAEARQTRTRPSSPAPAGEQVVSRPIVDRLVTITLDPGHGGEDPGAVGVAGSYEKHVTLAVAKR
jgi:N-acetylmuramoyl-L-alanine amidase